MSKILFVSPHPDDETLGCGGTIPKHGAMGDEIYWLIMTNISTGEGYAEMRGKERQHAIDTITKKYGFGKVFKLCFPTTKLDHIQKNKMIMAVSDSIHKIMPAAVYLPNRNDVHSDHKATFDVVIGSTKTFRCPFIKKVLTYEVISETEFSPPFQINTFVPNSFSDILKYLDRKISIMEIYKNEMGDHPFPRSIENLKALATFRGATAGVKYAEAFVVLKEIW